MSLLARGAGVALDGAAVGLLGWTTWTAFRARERPSARPFLAVVGALTLWAAFTLGSELPIADGASPVSSVLDLAQFGIALVIPGVLTVYALSYTGRGTGLTRRRIAMLAGIAFPVAASAVVLAAGPPRPVMERVIASLLGWEILYLFALFVYATYLLVGLGRSHARVSRLQVTVVVAAVAAPYLLGTTGDGQSPVDGVTLGLLVSGGLLAVAVRRYPVMTGFPKADYVARTRVVEALQEAVVVLDWDDHLIDVNARTSELFGDAPAALVGEPIRSVVDGIEGADLSVGTTGTVTLGTTRGRRQFQYSVSAVGDAESDREGGGRPVARAVLFRDVTDRQTREQRLAVLNRVLRHNVRNELDVVLAHAERIDDPELRSAIRESATDLVALSDRAREAEEVMTASTGPPDRVDLAAVAGTVAEQYRSERPEAEISLTRPDELVLSTHRPVVREVLSELVDNAITHSEKPAPTVEITVREGEEGAAELVVADDGPGIPDRERRILAGGAETQREHGRGIGLWFVNWAVTQLGGDLAFGENDPEGSVVTVRLYDAEYGAGSDAVNGTESGS